MSVEIGDSAPEFSLPSDGGGTISLRDLRGRKVVLYFYPKDDTPGCTKEACGFRDSLPDFSRLGTEIVGVSRDSVACHEKFKAKHDLPFRLGADEDGVVCEIYGVWQEKMNYGRKYVGIVRSTFLIDEGGIVRGLWRNVRVPGHVEKVLEAATEA